MEGYIEAPIKPKISGYSFGYKIDGDSGADKQKIGPGYYEIQNSLEKLIKKSSTTVFSKSQRFTMDKEKEKTPGPGSYDSPDFSQLNISLMSIQPGQILSPSINSGSIKQNYFGVAKRDVFPDHNKFIPGPGTYDNTINMKNESNLRDNTKIQNISHIYSKSNHDLSIKKPERSSIENEPGPGSYECGISYDKLNPAKALPFPKAERDLLGVNAIVKSASLKGPAYFQYNNYSSLGNSPIFHFGISKRETIADAKNGPGPTTYNINRSIMTKSGATIVYGNGTRFSPEPHDEPGPADYNPKMSILSKKSAKIGTGPMRPPLIQTDLKNPGPGYYDVAESSLNTSINGSSYIANKGGALINFDPLLKKNSIVKYLISQGNTKLARKHSMAELQAGQQMSPGPIYKFDNNTIGSNKDNKTLFYKADRGISLEHYENGIPGPFDYEKERANELLYASKSPQSFKKESRKFLSTINEHSIRVKIPGPGEYEASAEKKHKHVGNTFSKSIKNLEVIPSQHRKYKSVKLDKASETEN